MMAYIEQISDMPTKIEAQLAIPEINMDETLKTLYLHSFRVFDILKSGNTTVVWY